MIYDEKPHTHAIHRNQDHWTPNKHISWISNERNTSVVHYFWISVFGYSEWHIISLINFKTRKKYPQMQSKGARRRDKFRVETFEWCEIDIAPLPIHSPLVYCLHVMAGTTDLMCEWASEKWQDWNTKTFAFYQSQWRLVAHPIVDCLMHDDSLLVGPDASNYHQAKWWKRFELERSRNDKVIQHVGALLGLQQTFYNLC